MKRFLTLMNEALAFLLELSALAAFCLWGFSVGPTIGMKLLLGIGVPSLTALIWGLFAAPRAPIKLPLAAVLTVKALVFGGAATALANNGRGRVAVVFAALVILNTIIVTISRRTP